MKISLITVCFNSESYIADTLISVDNQTWPDIEHIIIDGASSDKTLDIIRAHKKPWRKVFSEPDFGIYDAMNKGICAASGDVVGFINADDFYPSNYSVEIIASVFSNSKIKACWGNLCYVAQKNPKKIIRFWRSSEFSPGSFLRGWNPPHPTFFVRRSIFSDFGKFNIDYKIAADIELMARFLEVENIDSCYIPKVLVHMRLGGTTNKNIYNVIRQNIEVSVGLRKLGLSFTWPKFLFYKLLSRTVQFFRKPLSQ